jgi:diacylglycerol O-acyltransferase
VTHERVGELDTAFFAYSQLSIGAIVLDPPPGGQAPDFEQFAEAVRNHLRRSASFRQRLRVVPHHVARPVWVDDPSFDLMAHLSAAPVSPGAEVSLDEFASLAAEASPRPIYIDRDAPWRLEVVEPMEGGRLGLVASVDHARADGIAALLFFTLLLADLPGEQPQGADDWRPEPQESDLRLVLEALGNRFHAFEHGVVELERRIGSRRGIVSLLRSAIDEAREMPAAVRYARRCRAGRTEPAPFNRTRAAGHICLALRDRPLAPASAAAHAAVPGATVNDAMLAGVAAGLADWLAAAGEPVRDLRTLMPVDVVRTRSDVPGPSNRASRSFVRLPVTEPDAVERLRLVHERTERVKRNDDARASLTLSRWVGRAPRRLSGRMRRWVDREVESFNLVVSDFRGPDSPVVAVGCPVRLLYPLTTLAGFNGINVTITSMQDRLCYSVMANADVIADPGPLVAGIDGTLDGLEQRSSPRPVA